MYEAYEATPILERLPLEIESLTAYDGNLVVGTRQGHLLMYSVGESGVQSDVQLLRSNKNFSRKPITQVAVVPHYQILISLSDSTISIHDLTVYNFPLLSIMNNTKGASVFDVEIKHQTTLTGGSAVVVRLAVVVRKRLQLYYLKGRQFQSLTPDVHLVDTPRHVKWSKDSLVVDQTVGYRQMHVNCCKDCVPGAMDDPVPYSGEARLIRAGSKVLQVSGATMMEAGTAGPTWSLGWTAPPSQAVWQAPYVLAVVGRHVEVVSDREALLLQTLSLNKPRLLVPDESGGSRPRVFCASLSHVWCLRGVASRTQVDGLVCLGHYGLALRLLDSWGGNAVDCANSREHIHKLHAFHLFCNGRYQEALDTFLEIDTELLFVLGLFPSIMPEDCQRRLQYPAPPPPMPPDALHVALIALIDYLLKKRQRLVGGQDRGHRSSKNNNNNNNNFSYSKGSIISRRESINSVASASTQKKKGVSHHQLQVVDTSLLKCYLQERPSLVAPLLRFPDSRVSLAEAERLLRDHQRLPDLLLLLRARGQHQRALTLLRQHQHAGDTALRGTAALVDYLLNMGAENLEVIMQQVSVLAQQHPLEALRVCTGDGAASTDCDLPRSRVAEYLLKNEPRLALLFLEHIIHEWSDQSSVSHNALAALYRDCIVEEAQRERQQGNPEHMSAAMQGQLSPTAGNVPVPVYHPDLTFDLPTLCRKLEAFLRSSKFYTPATVLLCLDQHELLLPGRAVVLGRLGQHREALSILITALHDLPATLRYCSSHYAETGPASQVYLLLLELLVQCKDVVALLQSPPPHSDDGGTAPLASSTARADTDTTSVSDGGSNALPSGACDRTAMLLNLLHTYSRYIRLKPAVQLLPPGMSVRELRVFLQSWVRQYSGARRRTLLQRGVAEAVGRQVSSDMSNAQTNKVLLSTQTSCCICRKRLTRFSAFVVSASGAVCHFSCQERLRGAWQREVSAAGERRAVLARTRAAVTATGDQS